VPTRLVIFALALFLDANGPALLRTGLRKETEKGQIKSGRMYAREKEKERGNDGEAKRETERQKEREGGSGDKGREMQCRIEWETGSGERMILRRRGSQKGKRVCAVPRI